MGSKSPAHIEAFEVWYTMPRGIEGAMDDIAKALKERGICDVTVRTLRLWRKNHNWEEHALQRDADIQTRTDEKAVESIAEMNARHTKSAILAHERCLAYIKKIGVGKQSFHTVKDAIIGLDKAVAIERTARGEASVIAEQREVQTMQDIQVMLDTVSAEERVKIADGLKERAKATIIAEVKKDGSEGDRTRAAEKDTGASEEH